MGKKSKQNIGNAGEYYIAAVLSARNFVTTITLGRNEKYDILAVNPKGSAVKISVKAALQNTKRFMLTSKADTERDKDLFYAFVALKEFKEEPDFWIVPSDIISKVVSIAHKKWFKTPGKHGRHHRTSIRSFFAHDIKFYPKKWGDRVNSYYKERGLKALEKF